MVTTDVFATVVMVACNFMVRDTYWQMTRELCQKNDQVKDMTRSISEFHKESERLDRENRELQDQLQVCCLSKNDNYTIERLNLTESGSGSITSQLIFYEYENKNNDTSGIGGSSQNETYENVNQTSQILDLDLHAPYAMNTNTDCELTLMKTVQNISHLLNVTEENLSQCENDLTLAAQELTYLKTNQIPLDISHAGSSSTSINPSSDCESGNKTIMELLSVIDAQNQTIAQVKEQLDEAIGLHKIEFDNLNLTNIHLELKLFECQGTLETKKNYLELKRKLNGLLDDKIPTLENQREESIKQKEQLKEGSDCPWLAKPFGSDPVRCVSFHPRKLPWENAKEVCEALEGSLLQDVNLADGVFEQDLKEIWPSLFGAKLNEIWIGGNDKKEEGLWRWNDGHKIDFQNQNWFKRKNKRVQYKDCLTLVTDKGKLFFFHRKCTEKSAYFCELKSSVV